MGTHPIFESDFDCLTEKKSRKRKKNMKFTTIFPLLANCEMLGFSRGVMEGEYKKCECNTRINTNQERMSIEFGGPQQCIYKSEEEVNHPGNTDPFRIVGDDGKMYCKVLEGSCFKVQYYRQKDDGRDADCKQKGKFGPQWSTAPTNDSCTQFAFQFMGCAVNETRKLIEYQRTQKKADEELELDVEEQGMCQGEHNSNYGMAALHGMDQIHHIKLADKMFSRTYCCNESMCNSDDYVYHGNTMSQWMKKLEKQIANVTAMIELEKKKASSKSVIVFLPLLILSILS